jgi:formylglycine-generating enzyme required for sulfatase activity
MTRSSVFHGTMRQNSVIGEANRQILTPSIRLKRTVTSTPIEPPTGIAFPRNQSGSMPPAACANTVYPWGNTFIETKTPHANFMPDSSKEDDGWRWTNPVNAFPADTNGIYGMAGNVWEWCEDWYFNRAYDALKNRPSLNPCILQRDVPGLTHRVMRGGSYRNISDLLRASSRGNGLPQAYAPHVGFRCARNAN